MPASDVAIQQAMRELGKPYVYGDEGPDTFDCSGLIQFAYAAAGIRLPRTSQEQQQATAPVSSPMPGDLVFYGKPAWHVGLYIGGGKMIAAPQTGDVVKVQNVWGNPTYGRIAGAGAALAPIIGVGNSAVQAVSKTASSVTGWLGGTRYIVVEIAFVGLGIGLVGLGVYRAVAPAVKRELGAVL